MSAQTIQRELAKLGPGEAEKLTVREHLETRIFEEPPQTDSAKLEELQELVQETFSNDNVADQMSARLHGLATARIAERATIGQDIPVNGQLNQWMMEKAFRLLLKGCSRIGVARQLGISEGTHKSWLTQGQKLLTKYEKDPELQVTKHQLNMMTYYEGVVTAEGVNSNDLTLLIHEAAKDDWRAAAHLLARRHPQDWGSNREKVSVEVSGEVEVKHTGVLAVAPVAKNLEEWEQSTANIVDVDVKAIPDLTEELEKQEADD